MKRFTVITMCLIAGIVVVGTGANGLSQEPASWTYLCDAAHTGVAADPVELPLSLSWRYDTEEMAKAISTPAVGPECIYFALGTKLHAVERATGSQVWKIELNTQVHSALVLWEDTIYFGAADGKLWAVDAATGTHKWKYRSDAPVKSAPLIHQGVLYFGSDDKTLYAYDLDSDRLLWRFRTGGAVQSTPAIWQDFLFVSSQDGNIYTLRKASGQLAWYAQAARGRNQLFASPVVHRGQVLISAGNQLIGFDAKNGTRRWSFTAGDLITGSPAVQGRQAFIGSRDGVIYGINTTRGKATWRFPEQGARGPVQASPVLAGNVLLARGGGAAVASQSGFGSTNAGQAHTVPAAVWGLAPATGKLLWEYRLPQPVQPSASPGGAAYPGYMPGMEEDMMMMDPGGMMPEPGMMPPGGMFPPGGVGPAGEGAMAGYTDPYTQFVDAALAVAQGSVYTVGDDGVLYGFAAAAVDHEKPVFSNSIIVFPGPTPGTQYSFSIPNESSDAFFPPPPAQDLIQLPGVPPLAVTAEVEDSGSGVAPDSVQILMDGQAVPEDQIMYDATQGTVWWAYQPRAAVAQNYPAGIHTLEVKATDWYGNEGGCRVYFVVDNSLTTPRIPGVPQYPMGWPGQEMELGGYPPGYAPPPWQ